MVPHNGDLCVERGGKSDESNAQAEGTPRRHGGSGGDGRDRARGDWDTGPD
jgi:hypothetical protein